MGVEVASAARKAVSGTMSTSTAAFDYTCGHCGLQLLGYGTAETGEKLCHPDQPAMDCYRLVTVYQHDMPCERQVCVLSAGLRKARESGTVQVVTEESHG